MISDNFVGAQSLGCPKLRSYFHTLCIWWDNEMASSTPEDNGFLKVLILPFLYTVAYEHIPKFQKCMMGRSRISRPGQIDRLTIHSLSYL
jgi:hypothetical protein